jgi:hypothetical protein
MRAVKNKKGTLSYVYTIRLDQLIEVSLPLAAYSGDGGYRGHFLEPGSRYAVALFYIAHHDDS